jgi:hypothetical protein
VSKRPRPQRELVAEFMLAQFTSAEINALQQVIAIGLRGGDIRIIARSPAFVGVAQKIAQLKSAADADKRQRTGEQRGQDQQEGFSEEETSAFAASALD